MPHLLLRLLPLLALLGFFAGSDSLDRSSRSNGLVAIAANGMIIDPNGGGTAPGGAPVTIIHPGDPDR